jgi:hypothetical protein
VDTRRAPQRVFFADVSNELDDLDINLRSSAAIA